MKTIFITGANGFAGRNIINYLGRFNQYSILGIDLQNDSTLKNSKPKNYSYSKIDLTDFASLTDWFKDKDIDVIIHLAGILSKENDPVLMNTMLEVNTVSTANLVGLASKQNIHFIFVSTVMVYGNRKGPFTETMKINPENYYALTKSLAEDIIIYYNKINETHYTIFRPAVIYGEGQESDAFIPSLINTLNYGRDFLMTKGEQKRDFIYIDDFASAIELAVQGKLTGRFNIGSGIGIRINDAAEIIAEKINLIDKIKSGSLPYRENEIWDYTVSYDKLEKETGWKPKIGFEQGIDKLLNTRQEKK